MAVRAWAAAAAVATEREPMKNITLALASASALLVSPSAQPADPGTVLMRTYKAPVAPWLVEFGVLLYRENNRVTALEPALIMSRDLGDEHILSLKWAADALTGASPNGAAPANVPQTFTSASGGHEEHGNTKTLTPANHLPLDTHFQDLRMAFGAGWSQPLASDLKGNIGGNLSSEYDYTSTGVSLGLSKDLNDKNTTLSANTSFQYDFINPSGGVPVGGTDIADVPKKGTETKTIYELMLGVTQILSPQAFYQFNYAVSQYQGYLTDPYKFLTVLDTHNQLIAKAASDTYTYLYENRPKEKTRQAVFNRLKYQVNPETILDVSHRYTSDNWGVHSNTVDTNLRLSFPSTHYYLEPHWRGYQQSAANFYKPYVINGLTGFASADSRLGSFSAQTVGGKVAWVMAPDEELSLRIEQYTQTAQPPSTPRTGSLAGQQIQPDLKACLMQVGYKFKW